MISELLSPGILWGMPGAGMSATLYPGTLMLTALLFILMTGTRRLMLKNRVAT